MTAAGITYWAATCAHCGQGLWGMDAPRVSGWSHINPAKNETCGWVLTVPKAGTAREITYAEYRALRGDRA